MFKKTKSLFMLLVFLCSLVPMASASSNCTKNCTDVTIKDLKITKSCSTAPCKIGLTGYLSGNCTKIVYRITDQNGKLVCSCSSYCGKCIRTGVCSCTCKISKPGTYDVTATAYGKDGCCTTLVKKGAIVLKSKDPVPSFNYSVVGKKVSFTDSSTNAERYVWNFGDGKRSYAKSPTHTYKKAGKYTVCLSVYNKDCKCWKMTCKRISVR